MTGCRTGPFLLKNLDAAVLLFARRCNGRFLRAACCRLIYCRFDASEWATSAVFQLLLKRNQAISTFPGCL